MGGEGWGSETGPNPPTYSPKPPGTPALKAVERDDDRVLVVAAADGERGKLRGRDRVHGEVLPRERARGLALQRRVVSGEEDVPQAVPPP